MSRTVTFTKHGYGPHDACQVIQTEANFPPGGMIREDRVVHMLALICRELPVDAQTRVMAKLGWTLHAIEETFS